MCNLIRTDDIVDDTATWDYVQLQGSTTVHMDDGDTARVQALAVGSSTADVNGSSSQKQVWWSGRLIG